MGQAVPLRSPMWWASLDSQASWPSPSGTRGRAGLWRGLGKEWLSSPDLCPQ